jgi:hypothetical protein
MSDAVKTGLETPKKSWKQIHKDELVNFISNYYRTSYNWRESSGYHLKWDKTDRYAAAIYDPTIKAQKKPWQCCIFDSSITPTNVELTTNALSKTLLGKDSPLGITPREMGDELQAELHSCILDYEVQRSGYIVADYDTNKEAVKYGSGFMKIYWVRKKGLRRIQKPVREGILDAVKNRRLPAIVGFKAEQEEVVIKDDPVCECVHIRDIFLEPNSKGMERVLHRNKNTTYGELLAMSKQKNDEGNWLIDPDSVKDLAGLKENDKFDADLTTSMADKGIDDPILIRADYDTKRTLWEYWGPLPRKWIELDLPEETDEQKEKANEIVPGKALIASAKFYLASEVNPTQSMEPPFIQKDYIRTNQRYGIGVPELLFGIQENANETVSLRMDNGVLAMTKMFAVIEKYLVDPNDAVSSPGQVWRFKSSVDDIRKVFMEMQVSDVPISAFRETGELERKAQEVVGNNRATLGTVDQSRDSNHTLGGQELNKQAAFERFTFYAYIIGCTASVKVAKKLMEFSYLYRPPESIKRILGMQPVQLINFETMEVETVAKYMAYKRLPPNELELDYDFIFTDVFKAENKGQKLSSLMNYGQFLSAAFPNVGMKAVAEEMARLNDLSPELTNRILGELPDGPQPTPMAMGQGMPSLTKPSKSFSGGEASPMSTPGAPMGPAT